MFKGLLFDFDGTKEVTVDGFKDIHVLLGRPVQVVDMCNYFIISSMDAGDAVVINDEVYSRTLLLGRTADGSLASLSETDLKQYKGLKTVELR